MFRQCATGTIAYHAGDGATPLAWIVPGFHRDPDSHPPKHCTFVDVAYYRKTATGINLETIEYSSRRQAKAFLKTIFDGNPTLTSPESVGPCSTCPAG
jgi:hypothetical protein